MAKIAQKSIFRWEEIEELGDLERLWLVLKYLPDEELMQTLEDERGRGRNTYPVRAVWNSVLAGVIYQHPSTESLRRELSRNGQLLDMCGLSVCGVPPQWAYTRFLKNLMKHRSLLESMFDTLVESLREVLPDFGKHLALDSKAVASHGRKPKEEKREQHDGRRDTDADWGTKSYKGTRKDGTIWEKVKSWFGYKIHLVVDSDYELPVAYSVTKASVSDIKAGRELVEELAEAHGELMEGCEALSADKGYDDGKFIETLWEQYRIKPVIDIRNMWKDGELTRVVGGQTNVVHDYCGNVFCHCLESGEVRSMAYGGFEKERETLKYRCPAAHYKIECKGSKECPVSGSLRIKMDEDRRIFTPLARSSYAWKTEYKKRTAVERVNSRLDVSFGFERHFIRGQEKMEVRCGLAMVVMLAMALGRVKEKQSGKMRSLVQAA